MRQRRITEAQINGMFLKQEPGMPRVEECRKCGVGQATCHTCKPKYVGTEVPDVSKLGAMEDESARRQRLLADTMLDNVPVNAVLKDLLGQN